MLAGQLEFARHFDDNAKELIKRLLTADKSKRIGCSKSGESPTAFLRCDVAGFAHSH